MFQQEPNLTAGVEDLPMFWMLDKMSDQEKKDMQNEKRYFYWKIVDYSTVRDPI